MLLQELKVTCSRVLWNVGKVLARLHVLQSATIHQGHLQFYRILQMEKDDVVAAAVEETKRLRDPFHLVIEVADEHDDASFSNETR